MLRKMFCWKPDGTPQRWKLQHTGELFETHFWIWKSSLKTWLIQSSNLNSHDAVVDLFNFCIVLYVRFRYFLEFTFANLGFLLLEKMWELLENQWGEMCHIYTVFWRGIFTAGLGVFELFALAPIAFTSILLFPCHYTHIWLVLWVEIWNLFLLAIVFCWVFSLRRKQTPLCFPLTGIRHDVDEAFQFYYCCLQFFWTHPETMQCFVVETKSTFF